MRINDNNICIEEGELIVYTKGNPHSVSGQDSMRVAVQLFIAANATIYEHEGYEAALSQAYESAHKMVELFKEFIEHEEGEDGEQQE